MKLYIVIVEDRHVDVECYVFDTVGAAMTFAEEQAEAIADPDEPEVHQVDGWLYSASCSPEGDHVHVVEKVLNATE